MKTVKVQPLTAEHFAEYGSFYDMLNPDGHTLGSFYNDHILMHVSGAFPVGFSAMVIEHKDKMLVTKAEYHNTTPEVLMPIDDDIIIYVAPPSKVSEPEKTEAFIVPSGTMVLMHTGVWHFTPFPVNKKQAHVLVALPERIYFNDCTIIDYKQTEHIEIIK